MMISISHERHMRRAFAAGQAAATARFLSKQKGAAEYFARTPQTYEEWIESIKDEPEVAIL